VERRGRGRREQQQRGERRRRQLEPEEPAPVGLLRHRAAEQGCDGEQGGGRHDVRPPAAKLADRERQQPRRPGALERPADHDGRRAVGDRGEEGAHRERRQAGGGDQAEVDGARQRGEQEERHRQAQQV
jgi:hypothetical protein